MTTVPFLSYKILPSQTIVKEHLRQDHIKEDLDGLIHGLSPILIITKNGVPKPPSLGPGVIQHLADKPGTLTLLELFGWIPNHRGDYVFVNANTSDEVNQRENVANEFRQFYDELKKIKENGIDEVKESFEIITNVPFSTYHLLPADAIVRDNIRIDHIKQDFDSLIHTLTPVLYVTKTGVPKPPFLDPSVIEQLTDKKGTLDLLPLFGCQANHRGEYTFVDAKSPDELASREAAAIEFRLFYDELKKMKNGNIFPMEYFLRHRNQCNHQKETF